MFLNSVVSICGGEYLWPRFLGELSSPVVFFFAWKGVGAFKECVLLDICRNNYICSGHKIISAKNLTTKSWAKREGCVATVECAISSK